LQANVCRASNWLDYRVRKAASKKEISDVTDPIANFTEAQNEILRLRTSRTKKLGWSPRLRQRFGYFTPDECYEAMMLQLIDSGTDWIDVGCGHDLFPSNQPLAELLSARCRFLVGVDPSPNIEENALVREKAKCTIEEYSTDRKFDVISLRMVAEHIAKPEAAIAAFSRLTKPGGRVVIYTVSKWAVSSLVAAGSPLPFHHLVKGVLWGTEPEDTFPTVYRMNTRARLRQLFAAGEFQEEKFLYLDDCRTLARWRIGTALELSARRAFRAVGLPYIDVCILGVYRKDK
jgi:2-polyprenyl-3-methyl-5-hydroxy-6-metoxy-1,4-benzoquinol methylase